MLGQKRRQSASDRAHRLHPVRCLTFGADNDHVKTKRKTLAHPTKKEGLHVVCKSEDTLGAEPDGLRVGGSEREVTIHARVAVRSLLKLRRIERDVTKVEEPLDVGPISCPPSLTVVSAAQPCTQVPPCSRATVSWCTLTIAVPRENG
jgi:hypothetical protein